MRGIDRVNPLTAAGLAFLLQPWVLVTAGVADITQAKLSSAWEYLAVFAFCVLCSASLLVMETYAALRPAEVKTTLEALLNGSPRTGTRSSCSCRSDWASTSWPRASTGWSAPAE